MTDDASVAAAAALIEEQAGRLDVLVNNAGITGGMPQDPTRVSTRQVRTVVETNVIGVMRVTNAMLPLLRRSAVARASSTCPAASARWPGSPRPPTDRDRPDLGGLLAVEDVPQRRHRAVRQGARRHRTS